MYRTIIEIKPDVASDVLDNIKETCISAHKNRAGEVGIRNISEHCFVFEGEEKDYGCLQLGFLKLNEIKTFTTNVKTWIWEDEEPEDSCDLLEVLSRPVYIA